ncbi:MAG: leucyl aminopeptidase [Pseudomonadota bacterium]|nr:leucyl aminopeptidase [Pseudomonadota bacterium]
MTLSVSLTQDSCAQVLADIIVVGVYDQGLLSPAAQAVDDASGGAIKRLCERGDVSGKPAAITRLFDLAGVTAQRVLLVGLGDAATLDAPRYIKALNEAAKALKAGNASEVVSYLAETAVQQRSAQWRLDQHVVTFSHQAYRFLTTRGRKPGESGIKSLRIAADEGASLRAAQAIAAGVELSRELGNLPPNICTPKYLADTALRLAGTLPSFSVEILEREEMEKLGMGALLGVARGSANPPRLIVMKYQGAADAEAAPYVLIGKGITFDSGGISIKPGAGMDEMKFDMCGGGSVFGALHAVAEMGLALNVIGVVPAVENMPDGDAYRPGDVLTSMSGQTIEVLNTDAEGRLILCDAISYAKRFKPHTIVDIATLTGACVVALGKHAHGLMTHDDALAEELLKAGENVHDRAWRLPIWDDYQSQLDTGFADMANIGGKTAGAITAGCFLARFATDVRWAHLDIAGTAWDEGRKGGATGRPVQLLVQWLMDRGT